MWSNDGVSLVDRYPFLALEIFNCEINPMLEKFFEAPEPKEIPKKEENNMDGDDEVLTDNLGADLDDKDTSDKVDVSGAEGAAA